MGNEKDFGYWLQEVTLARELLNTFNCIHPSVPVPWVHLFPLQPVTTSTSCSWGCTDCLETGPSVSELEKCQCIYKKCREKEPYLQAEILCSYFYPSIPDFYVQSKVNTPQREGSAVLVSSKLR